MLPHKNALTSCIIVTIAFYIGQGQIKARVGQGAVPKCGSIASMHPVNYFTMLCLISLKLPVRVM